MAEGKKYNLNIKNVKVNKDNGGAGGMVYCLGLIGAAVYFVQQANGFGEVLVALIKAVLWPAYFVWEFFTHLS